MYSGAHGAQFYISQPPYKLLGPFSVPPIFELLHEWLQDHLGILFLQHFGREALQHFQNEINRAHRGGTHPSQQVEHRVDASLLDHVHRHLIHH